jgi:hypothetical protein
MKIYYKYGLKGFQPKKSSKLLKCYQKLSFGVGALMPTPAILSPTISTQFSPANNPYNNNPDFNIDSILFIFIIAQGLERLLPSGSG